MCTAVLTKFQKNITVQLLEIFFIKIELTNENLIVPKHILITQQVRQLHSEGANGQHKQPYFMTQECQKELLKIPRFEF